MYQKSPKTLTEDEVFALISELSGRMWNHHPTLKGTRNRLAALLMVDAGLRVGEVVKLQINDLIINMQPVERLILRSEITKTNRERTVPLTDRLKQTIKWCYERFWLAPDQKNNYPAIPGTMYDTAITTVQLQRIIKTTAANCLRRRVTPHMLRHTFATRLMRQTSPRVVQELLGHRNLASTQIYMHPDQEDLDNAINSM